MFPTGWHFLESDEIFLAHFCAAGFSGNLSLSRFTHMHRCKSISGFAISQREPKEIEIVL
jgi:hypothetical protein